MSSNRIVRLGLCHLNSSNDKESNLKISQNLIEKGKNSEAQMIFFPEAFDFISPSKSLTIEQAETIDGNIIKTFRDWAKKYQIWLSLGGFHHKIENQDKIFNTHLIINDQGQIVGQYSKIHLFDVQSGSNKYKESDFTQIGPEIVKPIETIVGRIGLSICYDLRFPEMSRLLTLSNKSGAQLLTYPSAFTKTTGEAHWHILLRARAIENQCFVVAPAQFGFHGSQNRESYGHSMVVDPWGKILLEINQSRPTIETISIDLNSIDQVRQRMPIVEHRREDLYFLTDFNSKEKNYQNQTKSNKEETFKWGQVEINEKQVFYRTDLTFAMVNRKPVVRGHVLLSPTRCVQRFSQLTKAEIFDLFVSTQKIGQFIERIYQGQSLTINIQDGPNAGQTIEHVHVHILPRREGDFQRNDSIYDQLEKHDKNIENIRTQEEMNEEAKFLRELLSEEKFFDRTK